MLVSLGVWIHSSISWWLVNRDPSLSNPRYLVDPSVGVGVSVYIGRSVGLSLDGPFSSWSFGWLFGWSLY